MAASLLRKQYHHRRVGSETHLWDVHKLIRASRGLTIRDVPLADIAELDENWWYGEPGVYPTPRSITGHLRLALSVDMNCPVLLCAEGRLMDGMHRAIRALAEGRETIPAIRFPVTPPPDHVDVALADLPYPDEAI